MNIKDKIKYQRVIIPLVAGIIILCGSILKVNTDDTIQMRVIYWFLHGIEQECHLEVDYSDTSYDIVPHFPMEDTYAGEWFEVTYEIPKSDKGISSFSFELAHEEGTARICSIEFYNHGLQVAKYSPADIGILFQSKGSSFDIDYAQIYITNSDEKIVLTGTQDLLEEYTKILSDSGKAYINCFGLAVCCAVICYCILLFYENSEEDRRNRIKMSGTDVILVCILGAIFMFSCIMALTSKHYAHCDEQLTRCAIDYYLGHWLPSKAGSHWQAGTYSYQYGAYGGHSRLNETSLYYLFAGKVGWVFREFFHIQRYYRILGLILIAIMLFTCWRRRHKSRWIVMALCITPQIWYLFSYATSDQWDWFWGFWILLLTLNRNSILYKAIEKRGTSVQICFYTILCVLLFAQMFLGKSNYIVVLAMPFVDLMIYWIKEKKSNFRFLLFYFLLLVLTLAVYAGISNIPRVGDTYSVNEKEKEVCEELAEQNISQDNEVPEYLSTAPVNNGFTFWNMLWNYTYMPTPALLFTSTIGYYVWSSLWGGTAYSIIMMILYICIGIGLLIAVIIEKDWLTKFKIFIAGFLVIALFGVTLLYCYYVTYQPQGRYILSIFLLLSYAAAYAEKFTNSKYYKYLVIACCIAGLWSFSYAGLYTMYQSGLLFI